MANDGVCHFCRSLVHLIGADADPRRRLQRAAAEFRAAMLAYDSWPEAVQREADALLAVLLADGLGWEMIQSLDQSGMKWATRRLTAFLEAFVPRLQETKSPRDPPAAWRPRRAPERPPLPRPDARQDRYNAAYGLPDPCGTRCGDGKSP